LNSIINASGTTFAACRDLLHEVSAPAQVSSEALHDSLAVLRERFSARSLRRRSMRATFPPFPSTSSEFVLTCDTFCDAKPDWRNGLLGRGRAPAFAESGLVPVVTGSSAPRATAASLRSAETAPTIPAIVAHVVDANELVVWTDVDGRYTANPTESSEARLLHQLSYEEAHALAAAGAKVLHAGFAACGENRKWWSGCANTFSLNFAGRALAVS